MGIYKQLHKAFNFKSKNKRENILERNIRLTYLINIWNIWTRTWFCVVLQLLRSRAYPCWHTHRMLKIYVSEVSLTMPKESRTHGSDGTSGVSLPLLAYLDDKKYGPDDININSANHYCGDPVEYVVGREPEHPTTNVRWTWREIANQRLDLNENYEHSRDASHLPLPTEQRDFAINLIWSRNCVMARFSILREARQGRYYYTPHYEEVLAYYMLRYHDANWERRARRNGKIVAYSSKPPCDHGGSNSIRSCSKLVDAIRDKRAPFNHIIHPDRFGEKFLYFSELNPNTDGHIGEMDWNNARGDIRRVPPNDLNDPLTIFFPWVDFAPG